MAMQIDFPRDRKIAQLGQKVDSTPCTVVSVTAEGDEPLPFGALLVYSDKDPLLARLPTAKSHLDKPIGISLRALQEFSYQPKSPSAALRQGRIWVKCDAEVIPGDPVYVSVSADGATFGNKTLEGSVKLKGAIYLESARDDLVPIEINFLGGAQ